MQYREHSPVASPRDAAATLENDAHDNLAQAADQIAATGDAPAPTVLMLGAIAQAVLACAHRIAAHTAATGVRR